MTEKVFQKFSNLNPQATLPQFSNQIDASVLNGKLM